MKLHRLTAQLVVGAILTLPVWAHAAGLGKLTVKSALGQPLSAEIELLVADKAELDSLNVSMASNQAFKDAQIEYAHVLSTLQFAIGKDAAGRPVLMLTSNKPVNDPFMDMLIELNWASGRLLREYTVLLDPPGVAVPQTVSPVAVSAPVAQPQTPPPVQPVPKPASADKYVVTAVPAEEKPAAQAAPEKAVAGVPPAPAQVVPMESYVRVKSGDSLGKVANRVRPANISLEQALVSLFHENPDAFQGNNMNRLKAGRQLKVPSVETMAGVDRQSAIREINLQAADWQGYRAKLAESVSEQPVQAEKSSKTVVGKITPKVEDKAQPKPEAAQDVLKLSKAAAPVAAAKPDQAAAQKAAQEKAQAEQKARAEEEDRIAREKAAKESAERAAALEKQIQDMQKLAQLKEKEAATVAEAKGAQKPPVAAAPKVSKTPPPVEEPQANWYDGLLQNPIYWIGGLGIVVLGGVLWWMVAGGRLRRKKLSETVTESLVTGGELQPNSAAGGLATGGVVNTGDTSFLTDFSQAGLAEIDTHDVDPIAEADVYMAYGRDAQAEEILKEALTKAPDRHEIRLKLLEIYAARKNVTAFESVAGELYSALGGQTGAVWDKAVEMGRTIDPHNPLYGGIPEQRQKAAEIVAKPAAVEIAAPVLENLHAMDAEPEPQAAENTGGVLEFTTEPSGMDLDLDIPSAEVETKTEAAFAPQTHEDQSLDFDLSGFDLNIPQETATPEAPQSAAKMDFSSLDLNLGDESSEDEFDEVATKLDLARAYLEMGDKEGAREILQEVINEGSDKQKTDARGIMASL
jgi:pilus assembly protein FimV